MGCCNTFQKQILFLFNLLFALSGIAILVVGILILKGLKTDVLDEITGYVKGPPIVLIVTGCVVFLVAFLGCCGARHKNRCMLILYALILLAILITELTIGIIVLVNWKDQAEHLTVALSKKFPDYQKDEKVRILFDNLQTDFHCCGVTGSRDYGLLNSYINLPKSCCETSIMVCSSLQSYKVGCATTLANWIQEHSKIIGGVAIAFAFIELLGIIFACNVANSKKK